MSSILGNGLYQLLEDLHPQTGRQLFYQAVSAGLIRKTQRDYKQTEEQIRETADGVKHEAYRG